MEHGLRLPAKASLLLVLSSSPMLRLVYVQSMVQNLLHSRLRSTVSMKPPVSQETRVEKGPKDRIVVFPVRSRMPCQSCTARPAKLASRIWNSNQTALQARQGNFSFDAWGGGGSIKSRLMVQHGLPAWRPCGECASCTCDSTLPSLKQCLYSQLVLQMNPLSDAL